MINSPNHIRLCKCGYEYKFYDESVPDKQFKATQLYFCIKCKFENQKKMTTFRFKRANSMEDAVKKLNEALILIRENLGKAYKKH